MPRPEIRFYNSLSKSLERFEPIASPVVTMYNCGPTVYDYAHIGNFKSFLFADVLRRFLELAGYDVRQVMNLTDVGHMTDDAVADGGGDDKMDQARKRLLEAKKSGKLPEGVDLDPTDPYAIAGFYADAFIDDAKKLGIKVANEPEHLPRATNHVQHMQALIKTLIEKQHAYVASDGAVYFAVQSFPEYGRLSGNTLEDLRGGAGGRVSDTNQAVKRHPADFLLWKPDATHLMKWDSPWGAGYPGWHIECSAMARAVLQADVIDIHTGGEDNIFPHHECEIAQSCGATGQPQFARFWMHGRHLMVEGEKMSKSKGNFFTVRQILDGDFTGKAVDPAVLRFELIKSRYRSSMNFTKQGIVDSAKAVAKIRDAKRRCPIWSGQGNNDIPVVRDFLHALSDDLNMSEALGYFFSWLNGLKVYDAEVGAAIERVNQVLWILSGSDFFHTKGPMQKDKTGLSWQLVTAVGDADLNVQEKCKAMDLARKNKDFDTADAIRSELIEAGYEVKTTKDGTVATKKLA